MQKYTNGSDYTIIVFEVGDKLMFQSDKYPELAPYPVEIVSVNTSMGGTKHPYLKHKLAKGDWSEWNYYTCYSEIPAKEDDNEGQESTSQTPTLF